MASQKHTAGVRSLLDEMGMTEEEVRERKKFLEIGDSDVEALRSINLVAQRYADSVIDEFYRHLLSFPDAKEFFKDQDTLRRVKNAQKQYFLGLTNGVYDMPYVEERLTIGVVHERIGLPVKMYLGMYNFYLRVVGARLLEAYQREPKVAMTLFFSLMKLVFMDISLAIETYIFQRERTIRQQQEAIRELSTPVLQIRERLLLLPIVGAIDSQRARQLTEQLLHSIRDNRARVAVIDVTGVPAVDSKVANHLVQTVEACRLMGANVIVTGLSSELAQTLVTIGVDLTKLNAVGDLQGGLEEAERLVGLRVVRTPEAPA